EVAELQDAPLADEDVHRREVAVEHLPAVQLSEDLQDPRDLAPGRGLGPAASRRVQERAEVPLLRPLEREAVEDAGLSAHERERVVDPDRPRVVVQELAEVRLAQPAVDVLAHLDADDRGHDQGAAETAGQVDLAEAALAEQALDPVAEAGLRARHDLRGTEELARRVERCYERPRARGGRGGELGEARSSRPGVGSRPAGGPALQPPSGARGGPGGLVLLRNRPPAPPCPCRRDPSAAPAPARPSAAAGRARGRSCPRRLGPAIPAPRSRRCSARSRAPPARATPAPAIGGSAGVSPRRWPDGLA